MPPKIRRKISVAEVEELLFDKRLILLLDGLNEMPADTIRIHLKAFREECQDSQVPLICAKATRGTTAPAQMFPTRSQPQFWFRATAQTPQTSCSEAEWAVGRKIGAIAWFVR